MVKIEISEETETIEDLVFLLEEVTRLVKLGFKSGVYPHWEIEGDEETDRIDD